MSTRYWIAYTVQQILPAPGIHPFAMRGRMECTSVVTREEFEAAVIDEPKRIEREDGGVEEVTITWKREQEI